MCSKRCKPCQETIDARNEQFKILMEACCKSIDDHNIMSIKRTLTDAVQKSSDIQFRSIFKEEN